jgi:transposase
VSLVLKERNVAKVAAPDSLPDPEQLSGRVNHLARIHKEGRKQEEQVETTYVGIDVSKDRLDVAITPKERTWQVPNDEEGIGKLVKTLKELSPGIIVLEPTGGYESPVAGALATEGLNVVIVNARQIRNYARAVGRMAKTDKLDALIMAGFAATIKPKARPMGDAETLSIKAKVSRRRQLLEILKGEKCRLNTAHEDVKPSIRAHMNGFKKSWQTSMAN